MMMLWLYLPIILWRGWLGAAAEQEPKPLPEAEILAFPKKRE